jgi:hypothetical protein
MYIITSYLFSILLILFIVATVLFKPSLFKRFIIFYFKLFGIDYYSKYFDGFEDEFERPFIWIALVLFILLPFIAIPLILFILFIGRIIKILKKDND